MAFIPSPGVARVAFVGTHFGNAVVNTLHFKQPAGATVMDMPALAEAALDAWVARVLPNLSNTFELISVTATDVGTATGGTATATPSTTAVGGQGGESTPGGAAAVITLRTASRGRTARGRIYLGPLAEVDVNAGGITTARFAALVDGISQLRADMASVGWNLGVLSLKEDKADRTEGLFRPVTAVVGRSRLIGYQRRRTGRK